MEKNLVGRCGLFCGACTIYRAQRDDEKMRQQLATDFNCQPEQVCCNGCHALTDACWGNGCKIVLCLRTKGYEYCFECTEFKENKCHKYNDICQSYNEAGEDIRANMEMIKKGQIGEFLELAKEKFQCPSCHSPVSVGSKTCRKCGQKL